MVPSPSTILTRLFLTLVAVGIFAFFVFYVFSAKGGTIIGITLTTQPDLERGLVGHWTFDGKDITDDTGVGIVDRSGQGNHGQFSGGATTSAAAIGRIGQAFSFDGSEDYVNAGNGSTITNLSTLTLSTWVKSNVDDYDAIGDTGFIIGKDTQATNRSYFLRWGSTGTLQKARCFVGLDSGNKLRDTTQDLFKDTWYHLVCVWDGNTLSIYRDGVFDASVGASGNLNTPDIPLIIGSESDANTVFFNGTIDDVRIYSRALSADEITRLYNLGR